MADDSLTARNRINQRNFRARRQNYIKELEERLRKYESDGVQATIEIQAAARQVTDQNIKLRNLLIQRFGMSEYDISNYLGFQQISSLISNPPFPSPVAPNSQFSNLAPAPSSSSGGAVKAPSATEMSQSYPTPPHQSDFPRALAPSVLDPALSLASLHKYPIISHDQAPFSIHSSSRHNSDLSITSSNSNADIKPQIYSNRPPDSPTDTLSESSNPATPAEQMQLDQLRPLQQPSTQSAPSSACCKQGLGTATAGRGSRPNDETACEEAARIIASMRGGEGNPDQVMLELGCASPEQTCKVKNLSIFQLMDRG